MRIEVRVKTKAKKEFVKKVGENKFKVAVSEAPEKGKANKAVIKALANHFDLPQIDIEIRGGRTSNNKTIEIHART